ncbi:MAG: sigma-70 family RNA polymerase sigma factor [Planctomycetota bacterium]
MLEDRVLIWRFNQGRMDALRQIYEKYADDLISLAANLLGNSRGAEDIVQEVFVRFAQSIGRFQLRGSLKGYLATCVANRSRDRLRKEQRHGTVGLELVEQSACSTRGPVELAMQTEQLARLAEAMRLLPFEQREVIILRLQGGLKFRQIAKARDILIKTAQGRYRYGIDKLRSILDGEAEK